MTRAELQEVLPVGTVQDHIACLKRELALRHAVYPKLIEGGRLTVEKATREVGLMNGALRSLEELEDLLANMPKKRTEEEPVNRSLFDE